MISEPSAAQAGQLQLTVLFSPASRQVREWSVSLPPGARLMDAFQAAEGLQEALAAAGVQAPLRCGIWGRLQALDTVLRDMDRIEVYRPLTVDPKVARRERFHKQGRRSAGLFSKKQRTAPVR